MAAIPSPPKPYEKPTESDTLTNQSPSRNLQDTSGAPNTTILGPSNMTSFNDYSSPYGAYGQFGQYGQGPMFGQPGYGQYGQGPMMPGPYSPMMTQADYMMAGMDMGVRSIGRLSQLLQGNFEALHMGGLSVLRLFGNLAMLKYELGYVLRAFALFKGFHLFWLKIRRSVWNLLHGKPKSLDQAFDEAWKDASHELDTLTILILSILTYYAIKFLWKKLFPPSQHTKPPQQLAAPLAIPHSHPMLQHQMQYPQLRTSMNMGSYPGMTPGNQFNNINLSSSVPSLRTSNSNTAQTTNSTSSDSVSSTASTS